MVNDTRAQLPPEIGRPAIKHSGTLPVEREIFRAFILPDDQGRRVDLEDFRGKNNLVLVLVREMSQTAESLLSDLSEAHPALLAEEAAVVPIIDGTEADARSLRERLGLQFPVLYDEEGTVMESFCGDNSAIYITDRFREIFAARSDDAMLSATEILEWLAHVNRQCPECGVPTWPM